MEFEILLMQQEDVPEVTALEEACFSEPWTENGFLDALKKEDALFLVAKSEGRVIGFCGLYISLDEGDITNVAVSETERQAGIGHALISEIKTRSAARGVSRIFLEVRESNIPAQRLYNKNGFEVVGMRKHFYRKPDENAILMMYEA